MSIFSIPNNKYMTPLAYLAVFSFFAVAVMVPRSLAFILLLPGFAVFIPQAIKNSLPALNLKLLGGAALSAILVIALNLFISIDFEASAERLMKLSGLFLLGGLSFWGYRSVADK